MKNYKNVITIFLLSGCATLGYNDFHTETAHFDKDIIIVPSLVTAGNASNFKADLSSNGAYILYTSNKSGNKDIWEKRISKGFTKKITFHTADDMEAVYAPNGNYAAFISRRFDAAGDLHIIELGGNAFSSDHEQTVKTFSNPKTEDSQPQWFPNSEQVVYVSRPQGSDNPQISIANLETGKTEIIEDVIGSNPTVAPSGNLIAYTHKGSLFIYDISKQESYPITKNKVAKDGQPAFSYDSKILYFIRYADDTNNDGILNGDDRPSIWSVPLTNWRDSVPAKLAATQVTSAAYASYYPKPKKDLLYFTMQVADSLDIYRLPITGNLNENRNNLNALPEPHEFLAPSHQSFIQRRKCSLLFRNNQENKVKECLIKSLYKQVNSFNIAESSFIYETIQETFPNDDSLINIGKILLVKLKSLNLTYPRFKKELSDKHISFLEKSITAVEDLSQSITNDKYLYVLAKSTENEIKARILATKKDYFKSLELIEGELKSESLPLFIVAPLQFLKADLLAEVLDPETTIQNLVEIISQNKDNRLIGVRASKKISSIILSGKADPLEALIKAKNQYIEVQYLPEKLHEEIVNIYLKQGKIKVAANELREYINIYTSDPHAVQRATEKLVTILPDSSSTLLEEELLEVASKIEHSSVKRNISKSVLKYLVRTAEKKIRDQEYKVAGSIYRKILEKSPLNLTAERGLIYLSYLENKHQDEIEKLEEKISEHPSVFEYKYLLAYAKSFKMHDNTTPGEKISIIEDAIDLVEEARIRGSKNPYIHQTLGWLYFQYFHWNRVYKKQGGLLVNLKSRWSLVISYLGFEDRNWLEAAIDAYLISYYLSDADSLQRAQISQNLGEAYFELMNHRKALSFYVKRIREIETYPTRSFRELGIITHKAGKSAFQLKELELASDFFRRSEIAWQQANLTGEITRNIDYQAMSQIEAKKFNEASSTYQKLCEVHDRNNAKTNQAICLINQAHILIYQKEFDKALKALNQSNQIITQTVPEQWPDKSIDAIEIPIAPGQSSQSNGFTKTTRQLQIQTMKMQVYREKGEINNLIEASIKKISLQEMRKEEGEDEGKDNLYFLEELSVSHNNLGILYRNIGSFDLARQSFKKSLDYATQLIPEGQTSPTRGVWLNSSNLALTNLRKQREELNQTQLDQAIVDINQILSTVPPNAEDMSYDDKNTVVRLHPIKEELQKINNIEHNVQLQETTKLALDLPHDPRQTITNLLTGSPGKSELPMSQALKIARDETIAKNTAEWKYFLYKNMWLESYLSLKNSLLNPDEDNLSPTVSSIQDLEIAHKLLSHIIQKGLTPDSSSYRMIIDHYTLLTAMGLQVSLPKKRLEPNLASLDEISESLDEECALTLYKNSSGMNYAYIQKGSTVKNITQKSLDFGSLSNDINQMECDAVYITSNEATLSYDWSSSLKAVFTYIISPNNIPMLKEQEGISTYSVLELGVHQSMDYSPEDLQEHRFFETTVQWSSDANVLIYSAPLYLNTSFPNQTYLDRRVDKRDSQTSLEKLFNRDLDKARIIAYPHTKIKNPKKEFTWLAYNLLHLASLASDTPTTVISTSKFTPPSWKNTFSKIYKREMVSTLTNQRAIVFGFAGANIENLQDELLDRLQEASEEEEYREAIHIAKALEKRDLIPELLENIRVSSQTEGDWEPTYLTQLKIIARIEDKTDTDYADESQKAGLIAIRLKKYDLAIKHIKEAIKIYEAEEYLEEMSIGLKYLAIASERQKKYPEAVDYFEKAREILLDDENEESAALMLRDIGNLYNLRFGDYPKALEYYQKSLEELSDDDLENRVKINTDIANTLIVIGRIKEAIEILSHNLKIIESLDNPPKKLWVRTANILANGLFRSGQYQASKSLNATIASSIEEIEDETTRIMLDLDASNLEAMLEAQTGSFDKSVKIFEQGINEARTAGLLSKLSQRLNNLGFWYREYGQLSNSVKVLEEALRIDRELNDKTSEAYDLRNLGISLALLGDLERAESYLVSSEKMSLEQNLSYNAAFSQFGLGDIALRKKEWKQAVDYFSKALEISQKGYLLAFKWRAMAGIAKSYNRLGNLEKSLHHYAMAIETIEKQRPGQKRTLSQTGLQSDLGVEDVYEAYITLLMRNKQSKKAWLINQRAKSRVLIDSLANQITKIQRESDRDLLHKNEKYRSLIEENPDNEEHKKQYTKFKVAVSEQHPYLSDLLFTKTPTKEENIFQDSSNTIIDYYVSKEFLFIWVINQNGLQSYTVKESREDIESLVLNMQTLIDNYSTTKFVGRELEEILLKPVQKHLDTTSNITIIPHSILHYLSFNTLPYKTSMMIDNFSITYSDVYRRSSTTKNTPPSKQIVALGNGTYDGKYQLPFAEKEAQVIKRYYPSSKILTGREATLERLKTNLDNKNILHIAAHGSLDTKSPLSSSIALNGESNLTVSDLFNLKLNTELTVLSGCETGIRPKSNGDEVISLQYAAMYAGSKSVISTLWRVNDVSSAMVMKRFYRYLSEGESPNNALSRAQKKVREYFKHPAYWGSYRIFSR